MLHYSPEFRAHLPGVIGIYYCYFLFLHFLHNMHHNGYSGVKTYEKHKCRQVVVFNSQALFPFSTSRPLAESRNRIDDVGLWPKAHFAISPPSPPNKVKKKKKKQLGEIFLLRKKLKILQAARPPVLSKTTYKCYGSLTFPSRHRVCVWGGARREGVWKPGR